MTLYKVIVFKAMSSSMSSRRHRVADIVVAVVGRRRLVLTVVDPSQPDSAACSDKKIRSAIIEIALKRVRSTEPPADLCKAPYATVDGNALFLKSRRADVAR